MFGYIAPVLSVLSEERKQRYRSFYCGVCHALLKRHGQARRLSLSNDMTFLAMLLSSLYEPETGICLTLYTDRPGLQFYSGGNMNGYEVGKRGGLFHKFSGVALETQFYPDAPHHDNFPSTVLRPGEKYQHTVIYKLSVK